MLALVLTAVSSGVPTAIAADSPDQDAPDQQDSGPTLTSPAKVKAKKKRKRSIKVRKLRPKSGATFVRLDATVRIRFNRAVDPETINRSTVSITPLGGEALDWTATFEKNGKLAVLTPVGFFDPGKDYQVSVRFGVTSTKGDLLKKQDSAIFFTDANVAPLQFIRPDQFEKITSTMFDGRTEHSATLLNGGRVLLAGGMVDGTALSTTADFFDPVEDEFRVVPSRLTTGRAFHPAVEFAGGALLIGGWDGVAASDTTELFDPSVIEFRPGPGLVERRDFVDAVRLDDGRVLVVGGLDYVGNGASFSVTAEIYDASRGSFRLTLGSPEDRRAGHRLTLLLDGRVLVTGGQAPGAGGGATAEIFDPRTETFEYTTTPPLGFRQLHTATLLSDGRVFIADGGNGKMELFDPETGRFFAAGGASFVRRTKATASLLPGDKVLLLGGFDQRGTQTLILESMDLYLPFLGGGIGRVVRPDVVLDSPRAGHTATTLTGGRVLIAGGYGPGGGDSLATALIFDPR